MTKKLEDTWQSIRDTKVERYQGASPWPFVALVGIFVAAYLVCGVLGLDAATRSAITGLAGVAVGGSAARTWNVKNGRK